MNRRIVSLDGSSLSIKDVIDAGHGSAVFEIDESAITAMKISRSAVKRILESDEVVYGINTGFGALSRVTIERNELEQLQYNLSLIHI